MFDQLPEIRAAIEPVEGKALERIAHRLKGSIGVSETDLRPTLTIKTRESPDYSQAFRSRWDGMKAELKLATKSAEVRCTCLPGVPSIQERKRSL